MFTILTIYQSISVLKTSLRKRRKRIILVYKARENKYNNEYGFGLQMLWHNAKATDNKEYCRR